MSINVNGTEIESVIADGTECDKVIADGVTVFEKSATPEVPTDCLMFVGETGDFTLTAGVKEWDGTVEYSTDRSTWTEWGGTAISSANSKLYLRGNGNTTLYTSSGTTFILSAKAGCYGNIQTLLQYDNPPIEITSNYCYRNLFRNCTVLTQAPELPATTLTKSCYYFMFCGCTGLTQAPELPATTLANSCYYNMFNGCTSLTQAPELPATTLANSCYVAMFRDCTGLTQAPELPATTLVTSCYYDMFRGCTGLTQAPELPATTLVTFCYYYMFRDCTSIRLSSTQTAIYKTPYRIPTTGTGSAESNALQNMFANTGGAFTGTPDINTTYYGAWD